MPEDPGHGRCSPRAVVVRPAARGCSFYPTADAPNRRAARRGRTPCPVPGAGSSSGRMDVVCVGGGPAGLFFAVCARRRAPGLSVRVVERNRPGATSGWGVTYSDRLMDLLHENDPVAAREVRDRSVAWHEQEWLINGSPAYVPHFRSALERS